MSDASSKVKPPLAPIDATRAYPLTVFQRFAGMGAAARRTAERNGLRVCTGGGRRWVLGADWIAYLDRINKPKGPA